jgi:hypothetical protein
VLGTESGGRARGPHARTHDADTYSISLVVYFILFFIFFFFFGCLFFVLLF